MSKAGFKIESSLKNNRFSRIEQGILAFIAAHLSITERELLVNVKGRRSTKVSILRSLVGRGIVDRIGDGIKGDPFIYSLSKIAMSLENSVEDFVV